VDYQADLSGAQSALLGTECGRHSKETVSMPAIISAQDSGSGTAAAEYVCADDVVMIAVAGAEMPKMAEW